MSGPFNVTGVLGERGGVGIVGGRGGGDRGRCKAEVVVEGGLGAEAEDEDEGGAVRADARNGGEVEDACAVSGVEVGEVGSTAGWGANGTAGEAVVGGGDGGLVVEVRGRV